MKVPYLEPIANFTVNYAHRLKKGHLPNELIFFVTTRCGYKCKTCFYWQELNTGKNELTLEEIRKISASLSDMSRVLVTGGEPYLRSDLPEICKIFHDQNRCKRFHIPTHGFNPDRITEMAERTLQNCPHSVINFGFSIDGLQETHEAISQIPGSFAKVIETAKRVSRLSGRYSNMSVHVICVVSNQNYGEVLELARLLKEEVPLAGFLPTPLRGEPLNPSLRPPSREEWLELTNRLEAIIEHSREANLSFPLDRYFARSRRRYFDKITAEILETDQQPVPCTAGDTIGVMEPDGRIKLCELKLAFDVGNLRDAGYDFRKVWFSPEADRVREKVKTCSCYHGCFLTPSLYYSPLHLIRSLFPN